MVFQTKMFETQVSASEGRIVEGYFSKFNNEDLDGDIIMPGAFRKSLMERGPKAKNQIKFLSQHNPLKPLGPIIELSEDDFGLKYKAKISNTSYGNDILELIKDGSLNQHSIGFNVIKQQKNKSGINEISEIKLYEGSVVTFGSNPETPITNVKTVGQIYDELEYINTQLRKGNVEDITLLELKLKQLQQAILDMPREDEQSEKDSTEQVVETPEDMVDLVQVFKENISFLKK